MYKINRYNILEFLLSWYLVVVCIHGLRNIYTDPHWCVELLYAITIWATISTIVELNKRARDV